jgi:2-methylcitrate dehydratase PrpD
VLSQLGDYVSQLSYDDIPGSTLDGARKVLQHNILVALAAKDLHVPGQDRNHWPDGLGRGASATRLTDGRSAPVEQAVVTNALAMCVRAQHDEHPGAISHLGSTVIPPLLAVGEASRASGAQLLTAMVAGYEVGARVGAASVQATSRRGFRPTGLYGPLAGAAAAAKTLGAGADVVTSALAFAANTSAGLTQTWLRGTDEWTYQTAFAARNGYVSARLAAEGARGAADTLEGANGFDRAFAASEIDAAAILDGLGITWAIDDVLLKPYPACAFNQAPIQQLLALRAMHGVKPDRVERIVAHLPPQDLRYPGVDNLTPVFTRVAALMCLRTCLALAMLNDDVTLDQLEHPDSPEVRALIARIDLVADEELATHTSFVEVRVANGTLSSGDPMGAVYDDAVSASLVHRLQPLTGMDDRQMDELVGTIKNLAEADDIGQILRLVRSSAGRVASI